MHLPPAASIKKSSSPPPFAAKKAHHLRSRQPRTKTVADFDQASRLLQAFHAHISHSLDSIIEDDEIRESSELSAISLHHRQMRKAQTMACLSQMDISSSYSDESPRATTSSLQGNDWEFGIDENTK
eukprot:scaffold1034_cov127-Cylindrotheca_fusiformis.AAC.20